jgi:hypothetical protein
LRWGKEGNALQKRRKFQKSRVFSQIIVVMEIEATKFFSVRGVILTGSE